MRWRDYMAEKNYAILRIQKLNRSRIQEIKKRCEHVNRVGFANNVNKDKSHLNRCVIGDEGADWYDLFKFRYKQLEHYKKPGARKLASNAVIGVEAVTTMSHDMIDKVNINEWVEANNNWMKDYFGEENVVHGVLHMDEATPHIHYFITPVKDGKFNAREMLGGMKEYTERQTEYAKAMEPFGLTRGLKRGYRADHKEITQLYATRENLEELPKIVENESLEEYLRRVGSEYKALQVRIKYLEQEIEDYKITQGYAAQLEKEKENLEKEYKKLIERNKRLEHNFKYRRIGDYLVEDIIYAIENYPDQDVIKEYLNYMKPLNDWGKKYNDRIDRENEHREFSDIGINEKENDSSEQ